MSPWRRKIACVALAPSWQMASLSISPVRGLMMRIFLSLHVVTNFEPVQSKQALYTTSGWQSRWTSTSAVPTFQMTTWLSDPAVSRTFWAVGCQRTRPTRRWWNNRSATGSVMVRLRPPSGICQTLTTQSSEPEAMTLSLCGHQAISSTGPLCPPTSGWSGLMRPTCNYI